MKRFLIAAAFLGLAAAAAPAADLPSRKPPPAPEAAERAIWGVIAFAPESGAEGYFWGGASEEEATQAALARCDNKGAAAQCRPATVFYNGWNRSTPAEPWPHCGALATGARKWGAARGGNQAAATAEALAKCGDKSCEVVRVVCT